MLKLNSFWAGGIVLSTLAATCLLAGCQTEDGDGANGEPNEEQAVANENTNQPPADDPAPDDGPSPDETDPDPQTPDRSANDDSSDSDDDRARRRPPQRERDIYEAALNGDLDAVREDIEDGGHPVDQRGGDFNHTPLGMAVMENQVEVAEYLIERGADVNAVSDNGVGPLHLAVRASAFESVKLLVEHGATVESTDPRFSPLLWAARVGAPEIAEYLIEHGADVNFVSHRGETPILMASMVGSTETVGLLLEHGAEIEQEETPTTPLIMAVQGEHLDVVRMLLDNGADPNASNRQGQSPLQFASQAGNPQLIELLQEYGARP